MIGQPKKFTFFVYWYPNEESIELRQIGDLRPPNELIRRAEDLLDEEVDKSSYKNISDSTPVFVAKVKVAFAYFAGNPEKNRILPDRDEVIIFNEEQMHPTGDPVTGKFQPRDLQGNLILKYKPYQSKGWVNLNGEYHTTPTDDTWTEY